MAVSCFQRDNNAATDALLPDTNGGGGAGGCTVCNVGGTRVVSQNVSHYCSLRALRLVLDRAVPGVRDGASARVVFGWIILSDFNVVSCL